MYLRKKLRKLLNKRVNYRGEVGLPDQRGNRTCVINITHLGKKVSDHVWIANTEGLGKYEEGTLIMFSAIAYTYTDSKNKRKNGLKFCKSFTTINKIYDNQVKLERKNLINRKNML